MVWISTKTTTVNYLQEFQYTNYLQCKSKAEWLHFAPSFYFSGACKNKILLQPRGREITLSNTKKLKCHELLVLPDGEYIHNQEKRITNSLQGYTLFYYGQCNQFPIREHLSQKSKLTILPKKLFSEDLILIRTYPKTPIKEHC